VIFTPKWQAQENTQKQQQQQGKVFSCFGGALSPGKPKTPLVRLFFGKFVEGNCLGHCSCGSVS